ETATAEPGGAERRWREVTSGATRKGPDIFLAMCPGYLSYFLALASVPKIGHPGPVAPLGSQTRAERTGVTPRYPRQPAGRLRARASAPAPRGRQIGRAHV